MRRSIFLKSFSVLFAGEAVNVGLICSENEACDYPVPHFADGFPIKAFLPSFPALVPAGLQGKHTWGAGGRCSNKPRSFNPAKGTFWVLPLLFSIEITNTQLQEGASLSLII